MSENEWTTLSIRRETKEELRELKVHKNQSFDEVLRIILDMSGESS